MRLVVMIAIKSSNSNKKEDSKSRFYLNSSSTIADNGKNFEWNEATSDFT